MATAEFSKFAGVLSSTLSQHHLSGFEICYSIGYNTDLLSLSTNSIICVISRSISIIFSHQSCIRSEDYRMFFPSVSSSFLDVCTDQYSAPGGTCIDL